MSSDSTPSLNGTLGALEIGVVLATFLHGIQTLQTFNYYRDFSQDRRIVKIMVGVVWFLELANTICACHALYSITVTFYGQLPHVADVPLSLILMSLFTPLVAIIVQTFFALRVGALSKRWLIPGLCLILNVVHLGANLGLLVEMWKHQQWSFAMEKLQWLILFISSIGLAVELIIAISLCYCLWRARNPDFSKQTIRTVDTIIIWTIETTLMTSLGGAMMLILVLTRHDLSWFVFFLIQAKLFSNSLLASLNGRKRFRSLAHAPHTLNVGNLQFIGIGSAAPTGNTDLVLDIHRISEIENDLDTSTKDCISEV
ncbi:hypothetical protein C8R44DRAFT_684663 [Mycena epipterygia]|nr:hypothetical protein C8R44DRAFT_684663 [Mycena epipterygia]